MNFASKDTHEIVYIAFIYKNLHKNLGFEWMCVLVCVRSYGEGLVAGA